MNYTVTFIQIIDPYEEDPIIAVGQPQQTSETARNAIIDNPKSTHESILGLIIEDIAYENGDEEVDSPTPAVADYSVEAEQVRQSPSTSEVAAEDNILAVQLLQHFSEGPGRWSVSP